MYNTLHYIVNLGDRILYVAITYTPFTPFTWLPATKFYKFYPQSFSLTE